jgi:hypothetical protein
VSTSQNERFVLTPSPSSDGQSNIAGSVLVPDCALAAGRRAGACCAAASPVTVIVTSSATKGIVDQRTGVRGDQYVHLKIVLPRQHDPALEEVLRRWQAEHPYNPRDEWGQGR